jgi:hypothetical protein
MKLTVKENRETIKRYGHIKPAPIWGSVRCSAACPGTLHTCTRKKGHSGPHVAHGTFRRVVAVWWNEGIMPRTSKEKVKRAVGPMAQKGIRDGGLVAALRSFRGRIIPREHVMEEVFLLIFALAMVGFAIEWALRILGLW